MMLYVNNEFECFSCLGALMKNNKLVVYINNKLVVYNFKKHLCVIKLCIAE